MIHLTINTGNAVVQDASGISQEVLDALQPLIKSGGGKVPGFDAFSVRISTAPGGAVFSVLRGPEAIVICGLAWTQMAADDLWPVLERTYLRVTDNAAMAFGKAPERPTALPWLSVIILPGIALQAKDDVSWLGDFERCLAFAILEGKR